MKRFLAAIVSVTIISTAGVYEGTLGHYPIRMQLEHNTRTGAYYGRYTYRGKLLSIPLRGSSLHNLCEPAPHQKEDTFTPLACFDGRLTGTLFHGTWGKVGSRHSLPFRLSLLTPVKTMNDDGDSCTDDEYYADLNRAEIRFKPLQGIHRQKGLASRRYTEPVTHVVRSRVILADKPVQTRINHTLKDLHRSDVMQSLEYMDDGYIHIPETNSGIGRSSMREGEDFRVEYYHPPFLLLSYAGSIYCGGAHPYNYYDHYLFDLHTSKTISLNDLFDFYTVTSDGEASLTPAFQTVLEKHLIDEQKECYEETGYFEAYPAEKNRIALFPIGLSHAMFACATEPVAFIPLKEIAPFAKPGTQKYFPMLK